MKPTDKTKRDFSDKLLDHIANHILRKIQEIETGDEASIRRELLRQISDQLAVHFKDPINDHIEKEIEKTRTPKDRLQQQQDQIWQIAETQGNTKGIASIHARKQIEKPLELPGVKADIVYNWMIIGPKLFEGAYDKKSTRGRVTWACSMYEQLSPVMSIPEISDYLSKIARYIYGKKYDKRVIERALHRYSSQIISKTE